MEITVPKVYEHEIAKEKDFNFGFDSIIKNMAVLFQMLVSSESAFIIDGEVTPIPGQLAVRTGKMIGIDPFSSSIVFNADMSGNIPIAPAISNNRIDILEVKADMKDYDSESRAFFNPDTGNENTISVNVKSKLVIETRVLKGQEGSIMAPEAENGWIKLAEIAVRSGATQLNSNDIHGVTALFQGEENAAWTNQKTRTFSLGSLLQLKTMFMQEHDENGVHREEVIHAGNIDFGIGNNQVNAKKVPLGENYTIGTDIFNATDSILAALIKEIGYRRDNINNMQTNIENIIANLSVTLTDQPSRNIGMETGQKQIGYWLQQIRDIIKYLVNMKAENLLILGDGDGTSTLIPELTNVTVNYCLQRIRNNLKYILETGLPEKANNLVTLTDQPNTHQIPAAGTEAISSWLQMIRNNLKYIFETALPEKADNSVTLNDVSGSAIPPITGQPLSLYFHLQQIRNNLKYIFETALPEKADNSVRLTEQDGFSVLPSISGSYQLTPLFQQIRNNLKYILETALPAKVNNLVTLTNNVVNNVERTVQNWFNTLFNLVKLNQDNISLHDTAITNINTAITNFISIIYPIGSIYFTVSGNPNTLFPGTTWIIWGSGRMPIGVDSNDLLYGINVVEKTGGAYTVRLSTNEMPIHNHTVGPLRRRNENFAMGDYRDAWTWYEGSDNNTFVKEAGGGLPHNNMPPFIVCTMWKRTE